MDKEEIIFLRKVIKAQDKLLKCYRFGGQPPEWAFDLLSKFRELYDCTDAPQPTTSADGNTEMRDQAVRKLAEFGM